MIYYIDSSAWYKKYILEPGSETLIHSLQQAEYLLTSVLTELEIISALEISKKLRRINSPSYRTLSAAVKRDFSDNSLTLLEINADIIRLAKRIIPQRRLRAPDALQLASALIIDRERTVHLHFLCADQALLDAARLEGLQVIDVSS